MKKQEYIVSQEVVTTYYNISKYREIGYICKSGEKFYKKMLETFSYAVIFPV